MLTPAEIKQKAKRQYNPFLRSLVENTSFFPLEIPFGRPKTTADYAQLRQDVLQLREGAKENLGFGYTIEWQTYQTRQYGAQTLPQRVYFANQSDYLRLLGKQQEVARFETAVTTTLTQFPQLRPWLLRYPQRVIKRLDVWHDLLLVCAYFVAHPRPNCYIRELPVAVHTKFIEDNEAILRYLLDELLPITAIQQEATTFAERYHLRQAEPLVRLRLLDPSLRQRLQWPSNHLGLPLSTLIADDLSTYRLVIIENKMTFLTFPALANSIAIWGQGHRVLNLAAASWLNETEICYWGDLDVQGFEILAGLRTHFPQTRSWLMDPQTWSSFQTFAVRGVPTRRTTSPLQLTPAEAELYQLLHGRNLRLEQERISHAYLVERLATDLLTPTQTNSYTK